MISSRNAQPKGSSSTESGPHLDLARFDGNRDPAPAGPAPQILDGISNNVKNVDVGGTMWGDARGARCKFPGRQAASKLGKEIPIQLNAFAVSGLPKAPIYQYQVMVGNGAEKRGLIKAVWASSVTKQKIGEGWLFDGNSLAWSMQNVGEIRYNVDLDGEPGRIPPKAGRSDIHRVIIAPTAKVDFTVLEHYLNGSSDYHKSLLQGLTVLDHIMRETPSHNFISIKRSFFAADSQRSPLGGFVEHTTGVYQSLRVAHHPGGHRLVVNADVANGTFWQAGNLSHAVIALTRCRSEADIALLLRPTNERWHDLRRISKLRVYADHRKDGVVDDYVIDYVMRKDSSHIITFKDGTQKSIRQYFQDAHGIRLRYPAWPIVSMTKAKSILPLELLKIKENQRYTFKLDDVQTSSMIKRAVTPPSQRWAAIQKGVDMLNWSGDAYLKRFGMTIDSKPISVKARLLENPKLQFGGTGAASLTDPRTTGRWDLKGKKFASTPPTKELTSWGVCVLPSPGIDKSAIQRFVAAFIQTYTAHGAVLNAAYKDPAIFYPSNPDASHCAQEGFQLAGNKHKIRPQIMMFILPDKNSVNYGRIKRYCECKLGIPSQCVQYAHVQKAQPQYISNVLMKFNAKLGGYTNTAFTKGTVKGHLDNSIVVIGADVSHAAPGMKTASMAAITVSMNVQATRYAAAVDTNGHRLEMITDENIQKHMISLVKNCWSVRVGQGKVPATIVYFRDGVSEGQFAQVIDQEVAAMKKAFVNVPVMPKFLVVIASKRHHVRFFPQSGGDKNGNPLPGTLVDSGVTQPYENDFYLCSHTAIKGTARPVHYNVLLNECGWSNDRIHTLIYEHSYQYIRATTPVSLFPAVYYAHIASLRAAHHSKGFGLPPPTTVHGGTKVPGASTISEPIEPMLTMANPVVMNPSMWYI